MELSQNFFSAWLNFTFSSGFDKQNIILILFSSHHIPSSSVAPFPAYRHTHTTHNSSNRSDEGLTLETSAFKLFTVAN